MAIVAALQRLASAARVFFGRHGAVSQEARQLGVSRQSLYRQADATLQAVEGSAAAEQVRLLEQQVADLRQQLQDARRLLAQQQRDAAALGPERQAEFASTAQAEGVSLPVARRLLSVFLAERAPSVAQLGRFAARAARRCTALLPVLDELSRPLARQAVPDEIFAGRQPILMVAEPGSYCWLAGRKAQSRDGQEWAKELRQLPALEEVLRDAGTGLDGGVERVNAERAARGEKAIADHLDHFHTLREGGRALRKTQGRARKALGRAEAAQAEVDRLPGQRRPSRAGWASVAKKRWPQAERAFDDWAASERAWAGIGEALRLFTPEGELNTRSRAEARVAELLPQLKGPEWAKAKRLLRRPQTFTFLDQVHQELAQVPAAQEVVAAAVRLEGVRRRPELARGEGPAARVVRGLVLVWGLLIGRAGEAGQEVVRRVREVLGRAWRGSGAVEGLNSVVRMQQARHRRLTQGLLDLKRLYWNCRRFRTGRRRKTTPYERLGLCLPPGLSWWQLLELEPEQLRQLLLAHASPEVRQRWRQHGSPRLRQEVSAQEVAA